MATKQKFPDEGVDSMLKRFKKEVLKAGILQDLRKHEYYISPSEKRRLKIEAAKRRCKQKESK